MQHVDRHKLQTSLPDRIAFAREFIGFSVEDGETLNAAASLVGPLVKGVVDGVYEHLFKFDYTKASFLPANSGFEGDRPKDLAGLTLDDPQIAFRKSFLTKWALKVFTADYNNPATWEYLDKVGLMHTGVAGFEHRKKKDPLVVDLLATSLLLGWVEDVLVATIVPLDEETLPAAMKLKVLRAINRILWIQQDLFQRHYIRSDEEMVAAAARINSGGESYPAPGAVVVSPGFALSQSTKVALESLLVVGAVFLVMKLR
ncbi:Protoglobin-domain-containing protein [Mrakia frigida]|uniref:protoglobin family protein n=1 Tax=Mrakia frigida TaxID=29902 RepID=UPI003FCC0FF9